MTAVAKDCKTLLKKTAVIVVKEKDIVENLGFSRSVIRRIKKHDQKLYEKLAQAVQSSDKSEIEQYQMIEGYRGMVVLPENYDPTYSGNYFATLKGENWFATDKSKAYDYAVIDAETPSEYSSYEEVVAAGHRYYGIIIAVQVPRAFLFHERFADFSVLRTDLNNESVFITDVAVIEINPHNKNISEKWMSYDAFRRQFGAKTKLVL